MKTSDYLYSLKAFSNASNTRTPQGSRLYNHVGVVSIANSGDLVALGSYPRAYDTAIISSDGATETVEKTLTGRMLGACFEMHNTRALQDRGGILAVGVVPTSVTPINSLARLIANTPSTLYRETSNYSVYGCGGSAKTTDAYSYPSVTPLTTLNVVNPIDIFTRTDESYSFTPQVAVAAGVYQTVSCMLTLHSESATGLPNISKIDFIIADVTTKANAQIFPYTVTRDTSNSTSVWAETDITITAGQAIHFVIFHDTLAGTSRYLVGSALTHLEASTSAIDSAARTPVSTPVCYASDATSISVKYSILVEYPNDELDHANTIVAESPRLRMLTSY